MEEGCMMEDGEGEDGGWKMGEGVEYFGQSRERG